MSLYGMYGADLAHTYFLTSPTCTTDNEEWPITPQRDLSFFVTFCETCVVTTMVGYTEHNSQTGCTTHTVEPL